MESDLRATESQLKLIPIHLNPWLPWLACQKWLLGPMLEMDMWQPMLERRMAALMYAPRGVEDGAGMKWAKDKFI